MQKRKYPVERMDLRINMIETGARIRQLIRESGYSMKEIMQITGISTVQTIYKWYSGKSIPALETQLVLCRLFQIQITQLLVIEECNPGNWNVCMEQNALPEYLQKSSKRLEQYRKFFEKAA